MVDIGGPDIPRSDGLVLGQSHAGRPAQAEHVQPKFGETRPVAGPGIDLPGDFARIPAANSTSAEKRG